MSDDTSGTDRISALEDTLEKLQERVAALESSAEAREVGDESGMREFVDATAPENHVHRAVAIGAYLDQHVGIDAFTTGDVADGYREIRTPKPANLSDVLQRAEEQEYIMPLESDGQAKRWQLAVEGEELLRVRRDEAGGE